MRIGDIDIEVKVSGLAIVRDSNGRIKYDNIDNLPPEQQVELRKLIEEEKKWL